MKKKINWIYNTKPFEEVSDEKYLLCVNRFGQLTIGQWKDEVVFRNNHILFQQYDNNPGYSISYIFNQIHNLRTRHAEMTKSLIILRLSNNKERKLKEADIEEMTGHYSFHPIFLTEGKFDSSKHEIDDGSLKDREEHDTD